ncbi:MAG: HAMP domain-containing protein [Polyangiaceae bacterium]|nr:HAMP domain-containing protein [Polyangiaceae bacterium]
MPRWLAWIERIRFRLLVVNLVLVLVPVAGLEFARIYERQLLRSLERDMKNQATLLAALLLSDQSRQVPLGDPSHERVVTRSARSTRTRLRIIGPHYDVLADSHRNGPPEGPEPGPTVLGRLGSDLGSWLGSSPVEGPAVPLERRTELRHALEGKRATATRLRARPPAVLLFLAEPIRQAREVLGAVYVTRSTQPVLDELHRIRSGLLGVLGLAVLCTAIATLVLGWTLTRPIERLARAARRIAAGQPEVALPAGGGGEFTELSRALGDMTEQLQARHRYISEFAADVAHEFKSPLTSIRGAAELLEEGAADDPGTRARFLRNIRLDTERLDQLVSRLLDLSRIESSEEPLAAVSLDALVRQAVERSDSPDPAIEYPGTPEPCLVQARPRDLETALLNLLDNALRYSPPGVFVAVEIRTRDEPRQIGISVTDRGPGIPIEQQSRIFERFFTTHLDGGGTGLGLSIVQSVARAHGGSVEVDSEPGRGSTFVLWLPR